MKKFLVLCSVFFAFSMISTSLKAQEKEDYVISVANPGFVENYHASTGQAFEYFWNLLSGAFSDVDFKFVGGEKEDCVMSMVKSMENGDRGEVTYTIKCPVKKVSSSGSGGGQPRLCPNETRDEMQGDCRARRNDY
jgi:hypothetical protein